MGWATVIFCILAAAVAVAFEIARRQRHAPFFKRPCAGRRWRRAFPDAPKPHIREFLQIFADAFGLPREHRLAFRPDDRLMDIYRAMNPPRWTAADSMELETFALLIQRRYGLTLESVWREELTLGELFRETRTA